MPEPVPMIAVKTRPLAYKRVPPGWVIDDLRSDGASWFNKKKLMTVILSFEKHNDGNTWAHLSFSHPTRTPNYDEICYFKRNWIGDDWKSIMVFAPVDKHVNIHPYCLHLYTCLTDEHVLPEFSAMVPGIGRSI